MITIKITFDRKTSSYRAIGTDPLGKEYASSNAASAAEAAKSLVEYIEMRFCETHGLYGGGK